MGIGSGRDMAIERVTGIAVLSGKGGVGKSAISLNLALALSPSKQKTLLFDAAGGDLANLVNCGSLSLNQGQLGIFQIAENVDLYVSSILDPYSILNESDIDRFLNEIVSVVAPYGNVVFDCLTGLGPVSYTLAGLSEISIVVSTPDPTSIAGVYMLTKQLYRDGMANRCAVLFNQVESADEAASLKTRFDILTRQFLNHQFEGAGHIRNDHRLAESILEQQPLLLAEPESSAGLDFVDLVRNLGLKGRLQFETEVLKTHSGRPSYQTDDDK